jgi:general secretion pathway protein D
MSQSGEGEPSRTSLLGAVAPFLTSGRPETGLDGAGTSRQEDRRTAYTDRGREVSTTTEQATADPIQIAENGSKVTLNFVNTELQDFVRLVFDDVLKESVIVDPSLSGRATIRTTDPVSRQAALSLVRNVLQLHGATLTKTAGIFRIGARGNGSGRASISENIRVVPLRFIGAEQARSALQPLATTGTEIVPNNEGRYVVISGAAADLDALVQLLATLDVDQMLGLSLALVPLKDASAIAVATEVVQMFGPTNDGTFRALPIQRMNAVLLMARSSSSLDRAKSWIARLDQTGGDSRQMRVFPIQNRRAADLAKILNGMLLAQNEDAVGEGTSAQAGSGSGPSAPKVEPASLGANSGIGASPGAEALLRGVQVRSDNGTNSLVVMARPES